MSAKKLFLALALVVAATSGAMAQSAYTTGSAADRGGEISRDASASVKTRIAVVGAPPGFHYPRLASDPP
jgi:hypothetical protein